MLDLVYSYIHFTSACKFREQKLWKNVQNEWSARSLVLPAGDNWKKKKKKEDTLRASSFAMLPFFGHGVYHTQTTALEIR